jgi:hypothetical protein
VKEKIIGQLPESMARPAKRKTGLRQNIWPDEHQGILVASMTGMRKNVTFQHWESECIGKMLITNRESQKSKWFPIRWWSFPDNLLSNRKIMTIVDWTEESSQSTKIELPFVGISEISMPFERDDCNFRFEAYWGYAAVLLWYKYIMKFYLMKNAINLAVTLT